jgi:folate-dependent phosphoribosylglycinamide formyltransferase PurN
MPPYIYFVNRVNETHGVKLAVVESPSTLKTIRTKAGIHGLAGLAESFRGKVRRRLSRSKHIEDYNRQFGDRWHGLDAGIERVDVENINELRVQARLEEEKPDVILDHGTSIVKKAVLNTADLALNLHWGLSPYYRGTACTEWALINWDPLNIGVTIHKLARIIDGGDIVAQARAEVSPDDTVNSINMQLTRLGTGLVIDVLDRIKAGEELVFESQDYSRGYMTKIKQMTKPLRRQVEYIEASRTIELMLKKPARRVRLPIVELSPRR